MTFTRRFFVSVATAASAWGLMPRAAKAKKRDTLDERFAPPAKEPEKPERKPPQLRPPQFKLPCNKIYQVGITTTPTDVASGDAVWSGCGGNLHPIGMALTDSKAGDPVMLMVGFVPSSPKKDPT